MLFRSDEYRVKEKVDAVGIQKCGCDRYTRTLVNKLPILGDTPPVIRVVENGSIVVSTIPDSRVFTRF